MREPTTWEEHFAYCKSCQRNMYISQNLVRWGKKSYKRRIRRYYKYLMHLKMLDGDYDLI